MKTILTSNPVHKNHYFLEFPHFKIYARPGSFYVDLLCHTCITYMCMCMTTGHTQTQHNPTTHNSVQSTESGAQSQSTVYHVMSWAWVGVVQKCTRFWRRSAQCWLGKRSVNAGPRCTRAQLVGNSEESWSALLGNWVMFYSMVWQYGGFSHSYLFRFELLILVLARGYNFVALVWSRKAFPACSTWEERK